VQKLQELLMQIDKREEFRDGIRGIMDALEGFAHHVMWGRSARCR